MAGQSKSLAALDEDLLRAHKDGDLAAMIALYSRAADRAFAGGDIDAGCFFTVQAYVFALQDGSAQAERLRLILVRHGREA